MFLLSKENAPLWNFATGDWKIANGTLTGSGDSRADFNIDLEPPFTLSYKIKVLEGMRPRVRFGGLKCGNEGYNPTLALYPPGRGVGFFPYERKQSYAVSLKVTREQVEMYIDNQLISTGIGPLKAIEWLEFSGGDSWSKGTTEYGDITLSR